MLPEETPDNLEFQVDDLNRRCVGFSWLCRPNFDTCCSFTFEENFFDVVHSQMVTGGIHAHRWRSYIRDIFKVLRPGGWCQMVEIYPNAQSDNGTLERGKYSEGV